MMTAINKGEIGAPGARYTSRGSHRQQKEHQGLQIPRVQESAESASKESKTASIAAGRGYEADGRTFGRGLAGAQRRLGWPWEERRG